MRKLFPGWTNPSRNLTARAFSCHNSLGAAAESTLSIDMIQDQIGNDFKLLAGGTGRPMDQPNTFVIMKSIGCQADGIIHHAVSLHYHDVIEIPCRYANDSVLSDSADRTGKIEMGDRILSLSRASMDPSLNFL